jgi:hypothetical protein
LKLRWQPTIAALFRPNGAAKTMKPTGDWLYMRIPTFLWWLEALDGRIWEIGGERGSRRREERDALGYAMVRTQTRYTGAAEACDPLDF